MGNWLLGLRNLGHERSRAADMGSWFLGQRDLGQAIVQM